MNPLDHLHEELQRMKAAHELQQELAGSLSGQKEKKEQEKTTKRLFYAREQLMRSTFKVREIIKHMEEKLHGH